MLDDLAVNVSLDELEAALVEFFEQGEHCAEDVLVAGVRVYRTAQSLL
jgi:hypothetical protein